MDVFSDHITMHRLHIFLGRISNRYKAYQRSFIDTVLDIFSPRVIVADTQHNHCCMSVCIPYSGQPGMFSILPLLLLFSMLSEISEKRRYQYRNWSAGWSGRLFSGCERQENFTKNRIGNSLDSGNGSSYHESISFQGCSQSS